jgi:dihydroorotate dehydrogenase
MRRKSDEEAQIEHHMKKQIDLHVETSRNTDVKQNAKKRINESSTIISFTEISQIIERMTFTNEQEKSTLMSLNLNAITNRFLILSSIIDKKSCNQNFVDKSSRSSRRFVSVIQVNSSQRKMNVLALLRYKFKSSSRLKRSLNKSTSSSYQSNSNTQSTRNSEKW